MNINIKVIGIFPACILVNELSTINIKTMLLAPKILFFVKRLLIIPIIPAVIKIIPSRFNVPYFSSIIGPISRMYTKLFEKCFQS